mgnify:CR=1 FL=1
MNVYMARTISFLATKRLPQLGQLDKKEKYSVILVLFQLCEQERHFISKSTHYPTNKKAPVRRLFEPEAFYTGNYTK